MHRSARVGWFLRLDCQPSCCALPWGWGREAAEGVRGLCSRGGAAATPGDPEDSGGPRELRGRLTQSVDAGSWQEFPLWNCWAGPKP